tara:strand:+ start:176 stop:601 length:426 start_codon:yes stop_codon:yes gene_type:complete
MSGDDRIEEVEALKRSIDKVSAEQQSNFHKLKKTQDEIIRLLKTKNILGTHIERRITEDDQIYTYDEFMDMKAGSDEDRDIDKWKAEWEALRIEDTEDTEATDEDTGDRGKILNIDSFIGETVKQFVDTIGDQYMAQRDKD